MALEILTLAPSVPSYRQRTVLDGKEYVLELSWSAREERWYLDLRDLRGTLLVGSIKLVVNWPLLAPFHTVEGVPPGELYVLDGRTAPRDPHLHELGDTLVLAYANHAELIGAAR